jgi:membrane fusion protein (multidrug efflux system)
MNQLDNLLKRSALLAMLSGGLLTAGCDNGRQQIAPPPKSAPEVSFVTVQPQKVVLTIELPGRTAAYRTAEIRPQVSGIIQKRLFAEGADVKAGAVLYQIDPAPFQAALDNAEASLLAARKAADRSRAALKASIADIARLQATLTLARTNSRRSEELFRNKVASAGQRDQTATEVVVAEATLAAAEAQAESSRSAVAAADAAIQQAEAAVKTVRINLSYTKVTAPISGRIGISNVTEGAVVTAYQPAPLATIQQLDPIYADVPQSAAKLLQLRKSGLSRKEADKSKVSLMLEDGTAYPQEGTLQFSDVTVDPSTGSVILRAVFPNPEGILLPGMFVRTAIKEGEREQAVLIPQQGVARNSKGNPFALVVNAASKAELRPLVLDRTAGDQWLVSKGLATGDRVIVEGLLMLRPGTEVKAVPFQESAGAAAGPQKMAAGQPR